MPNITVQWFAGRTQDQKRQLTAAITEAMQARRAQPQRLLQARARAIEFYRWERAAEEAERVFTVIGDAANATQPR